MVSPAMDGGIAVVTNVSGRAGSSKFVREAFAKSLGIGGYRGRAGRVEFQEIVNKVCELAADGDLEAAKIVFDRLDGKVAQQLTVSGESDDKLVVAAITATMDVNEASRLYRERLKVVGESRSVESRSVESRSGESVVMESPLDTRIVGAVPAGSYDAAVDGEIV